MTHQEAPMSEETIRALLLNDDDTFTPYFHNVLTCLFHRFSSNKIALPIVELQAFSRAANGGREFSEDEMEQLTTYFSCNEKDELLKEGFMEMYHTQTCSDPGETWKDLKTLGYTDGDDHWTENHSEKKQGCDTCTGAPSFACSRCHSVFYCSKECQTQGWKKHKQQCKKVQAVK